MKKLLSGKPLVIGNWKMNCLTDDALGLVGSVDSAMSKKPFLANSGAVDLVFCPPAVLLSKVFAAASDANKGGVIIGAQDCHWEEKGAYTGDTSARQLYDAGARMVIVGHSERRQAHFETSEIVAKKARAALSANLVPCICVGENLETRNRGGAEAFVASQLRASVGSLAQDFKNFKGASVVIAYEPVWAIGSSKPAGNDDITKMHAALADEARHIFGTVPPIIYGGSVTAKVAAGGLTSIKHLDGVLVGGASLDADKFLGIAAAFA